MNKLEKLALIGTGAGLLCTIQVIFYFWRKKRNSLLPFSANEASASSKTTSSRTMTPLHHVDLERIKSRGPTTNPRSSGTDPGESSIFQIVLTGGPCGGKSR